MRTTLRRSRQGASWLVAGLVLAMAGVAAAEPVETIFRTGDPSNRVDIAILGDGYTAAEQAKYRTDVAAFIGAFLAQSPYLEYRGLFNVHRIDVVSQQSGGDHPSRNVFVNTALGATFDCAGIDRLLCVDSAAVAGVLTRSLPPNQRDIVIVLVNDPAYGGSGGPFTAVSTDAFAVEIVLHEVGHSFGLLADEYSFSPPPCDATLEPPQPNVTKETRRALIKWGHWISPDTAVPTPGVPLGVPGLYEGAMFCDRGLYRPTFDSKMRTLGRPFEQINTEQLIKRMYNLVSPIDGVSPNAPSFSVSAGTVQTFSVATPVLSGTSYDVTWLVDDVPAGTGSAFLFDTTGLSGTHSVRLVVRDSTPAVRSDPAGALTDSRAWTVTVVAAPAPTARLALSGFTFGALDTLNIGLAVVNPPGNEALDLYVGAVLPDGQSIFFFSETGTIQLGSLGAPAGFRPARTAPPGFVMNRISFFQLTFPRTGFAPGMYYIFTVLARIGAFADGRIDPGDIVSIDVHPVTFVP